MATTVVNIRMRQVIRVMEAANACSADTALDLATLGLRPRLTHKQAIYYLSRRGALVETSPGVYYLDAEATERLYRLQRKILSACLLALVLLLCGLLIVGG